MIPAFIDEVNLPVGGHRCTLAELEERFVQNEHRLGLFQNLIEVMSLARKCGFLYALLGGSFPTAKEIPKDIDLTWFCPPGTTKTSVREECIQIMEDSSDRGSFLFLPFDMGTGPAEWPAKMELWAQNLGFDTKTRTDRGVLLLDLSDDDPRLR
jgi:hypothetical protein